MHIERQPLGNQLPFIGGGVGVQETHIAHNSLLYHGIKSMQSRSQSLPEQQLIPQFKLHNPRHIIIRGQGPDHLGIAVGHNIQPGRIGGAQYRPGFGEQQRQSRVESESNQKKVQPDRTRQQALGKEQSQGRSVHEFR